MTNIQYDGLIMAQKNKEHVKLFYLSSTYKFNISKILYTFKILKNIARNEGLNFEEISQGQQEIKANNESLYAFLIF